MRTRRLASYALMACMVVPGQTAWAQRASTAAKPSGQLTRHGKQARKSWRRGQRAMDAKRVRQIQTALIREKYLKGRATGVWDERSQVAMARFQGDNHWQSKVVPDARALIKLGLGPTRVGLINPDTAVVSFALTQNETTPAAVLRR